MYNADKLFDKLKEIESLIRDNTNADGSLNFDPYRVMVGLELARRMAAREETETTHEETTAEEKEE